MAIETPLMPEHHAAGAQRAESWGVWLPETFSTFEREYRVARETAAIFDTSWHAVISLAGRDRVQYLHNISSNDIKSLADGRGALALLLNPQGRILSELEVYALAEKLLLLSHLSHRENTLSILRKYVIGSQVQIQDLSDQMGSFAVEGPEAPEIFSNGCGEKIGSMAEMSAKEITTDGAKAYLLRRSHFGSVGAEILTTRDALPALWHRFVALTRSAGGEPIGMAALNALRLDAAIPWFPVDFNDGMIPHEAALETTHISFNKGCYTGQEIVERVRSRGHVNRMRVSLKFSRSTPPAAGTKLRTGDSEIGFVTSAAFSPAAGTAIGMGYVRREQFAPGSIVEYDRGSAEVR